MVEGASGSHDEALIALARRTPWFMDALRCARTLGLAQWCIGAGAVRDLVWDALHEKTVASPSRDVDVAWFDATDASFDRDRALQERLHALAPTIPWEVTNQAGVHTWFEGHFGHAVEPLHSLDEAVASWPEFATAVAITIDRDDALRVIAPHGLDDLFDMVVRRNPTRVGIDTYRRRVAEKRYGERWPRVRVVAE